MGAVPRLCDMLAAQNPFDTNEIPLILALGEIVRLLGPVILTVVFIVGSIVNVAIALPIGLLISWKLLRGKSKATRVACGVISVVLLFVALWIVELVPMLFLVDVPQP